MTLPPESQQPTWSHPSTEPAGRVYVEKPVTVRWGTGILWVGVVLSAILAVVLAVVLLGVGGDPALAGLAFAMLAVMLVIIVAQGVLLVFAGKGRNWARIALAVVSGLSLVVGLVSDGSVNVGAMLTIAAVVLLFVPSSNEWYAAQSRR